MKIVLPFLISFLIFSCEKNNKNATEENTQKPEIEQLDSDGEKAGNKPKLADDNENKSLIGLWVSACTNKRISKVTFREKGINEFHVVTFSDEACSIPDNSVFLRGLYSIGLSEIDQDPMKMGNKKLDINYLEMELTPLSDETTEHYNTNFMGALSDWVVNIAKDTSNMIVQPDPAFFEIKNDILHVYSRAEDSVFFTPEKDISFAKEDKIL